MNLRRQRRVVAQHVGRKTPVGPAVGDAEAGAHRVGERVVDADKALENASPAIVAALAMLVRASRSLPSATAAGSASRINRAPCTQNASVKGEAKIETAASSACVSASIPLSAESEAGSEG